MTNAVYINNVAAFMPNAPVNNEQMEGILGLAGGRPSRARRIVLRNNGIKNRHYAIDPVTGKQNFSNAQLGAAAIRQLLDGHLAIEQMQALAFATSMADQVMPGHAVMVHGELQSPSCEVITTAGICVCGISALKYAYMGVLAGLFDNAVAGASEVASAIMRGHNFGPELEARVNALESNPEVAFEKDFLRWMLSDGAGAVLLQNKPAAHGLSLKIEWIEIRSFAGETEPCMYAGGDKENGKLRGWLQYNSEERAAISAMSVKQDVRLLNEQVIHYTVERTLSSILEKHSLTPDTIDWFLPHYSSNYFRQPVYDGLCNIGFEIPFTKWFSNLTDKGNTGSASIFIMLDELYHSGKLLKGQKILCYIPESGRFSSSFMLLTVA